MSSQSEVTYTSLYLSLCSSEILPLEHFYLQSQKYHLSDFAVLQYRVLPWRNELESTLQNKALIREVLAILSLFLLEEEIGI